MPVRIPFKIVSEACEKTGGCVILIGGQALGARGYQRATLDVDFMITDEDYEKLRPFICEHGYEEIVRTTVAAKLRDKSGEQVDVDFMFVDGHTFSGIKSASREEDCENCRILVPAVEHLIALKLHAIKHRPELRELKDLNDIVELIRANHLDACSEKFRSMCLKFGTPALYEKILNYTRKNG
jgi:predicted nucleotidyltransferase